MSIMGGLELERSPCMYAEIFQHHDTLVHLYYANFYRLCVQKKGSYFLVAKG